MASHFVSFLWRGFTSFRIAVFVYSVKIMVAKKKKKLCFMCYLIKPHDDIIPIQISVTMDGDCNLLEVEEQSYNFSITKYKIGNDSASSWP